jgi:hypothetical protein
LIAALLAVTVAVAVATSAGSARAQQRPALELGGAIVPAGEEITYLRALSLLDTLRVPLFAQPFTAWGEAQLRGRALADGSEHPWRSRFEPRARALRTVGAVEWDVMRPELQLVYNSALPSTRNDGVVWSGRGATTVAQAGLTARWGFLRAQLAPILFAAENANYTIAPNTYAGLLAYGDARYPHRIDNPQRFGDGRYSRLDPGESFIAVEGSRFTAGISTSRIAWGPGHQQNLVFSTNAGGFPHLFVGSARPLGVGIGTVNGRLIGGKLAQSPYSIVQTGAEARFTSAFVGSFTPRLWPGLELGATRVMQAKWRRGGPTLGEILRPFSTVINNPETGAIPNQVVENGFASAFARLAVPGSGMEIYGEMSREDFTGNGRWLLLKPDDLAQILLGASRSARRANGDLTVLRIEHVNGETSHHERGQRTLSFPTPNYFHGQIFQGLTSRGQILGSAAAFGGAGSTITLDRYSAAGRTSWSVERLLRLDWTRPMGNVGGTRHAEVVLGARYERLRFLGERELMWSVAPSYVLNRNVVEGNDLFNLELRLLWRAW